jgi:hypothetical protein
LAEQQCPQVFSVWQCSGQFDFSLADGFVDNDMTPAPKRRRFAYSLRTLFAWTTAAALLMTLSNLHRELARQKAIITLKAFGVALDNRSGEDTLGVEYRRSLVSRERAASQIEQ